MSDSRVRQERYRVSVFVLHGGMRFVTKTIAECPTRGDVGKASLPGVVSAEDSGHYAGGRNEPPDV
jgi:hypothetical protein